MKYNKGFNLLGIIIAMSIILVLAGIVLFGEDPDKRVGDTRDSKRAADVSAIAEAIELYTFDNSELPVDFASTTINSGEKHVLCSQAGTLTCGGQTRECLVVDQTDFLNAYVGDLPVDPSKSSTADTGYYITRSSNTNALMVGACETYDADITIEKMVRAELGTCGDGTCGGQENVENCAVDCPASCGDAVCSAGEDANNCAVDCPASCGDTYCTHSEDCNSCSADCGACANQAPTVSDAGRTPTSGATNQNWDQLLSWTAWTDPDGDIVEYQTIVYNGSGCVGTVRHTQGWTTAHTYPTNLLYSSTYSWRTKARDQNHQLESDFNTCYNFTVMADPGGFSCPFVYLWDGEQYSYKTDVKGQPIGFPTTHFKSQKTKYFGPNQIPLKGFEAIDGIYKLKIRETLNEMNYFDELKLMLVDHPKGYDVYSSTADDRLSLEDKEQEMILYTVKDPKFPISAIDQDGNDVLQEVSSIDNVLAQDYDLYDSYIELDFGNINTEYAKLVMDGWSVYQLDRPFKKPFFPYVETINENGDWEKVAEFGYINGDFKTAIVELYNKFKTDDHRVRVHVGYNFVSATFLDRIRIDDSEPVDLIINTVDVLSADLYHAGRDSYNYVTKDHRIVDVGDLNLDDNTSHYFYGNFTKYGDVKELLDKADDKFVLFRHGDAIDISFKDVAAPNDGYERTPILHADVLYKIIYQDNSGKYGTLDNPTSIYPLPFKGMSQYPYDESEENYPDTPEYEDYLDTWNTRVCETGKDFCYDLHTGHKILYADIKFELDIAAQRYQMDLATATDLKNLEYAKKEFGYEY